MWDGVRFWKEQQRLNRMESVLKNLTASVEKAVPQFNSLFIPIPALLDLDGGGGWRKVSSGFLGEG